MSDILHADTFHGTKKGGQRKYVRKAYEKSKQLRQSKKLSATKMASIYEMADFSYQLSKKIKTGTTPPFASYGDLQQMIVLLGRNVDFMMKSLTGKSIKIAL
tara:strand:- start:189 stop:494 length:306 start_codon:yes stop_codon:yes gene_type:complete